MPVKRGALQIVLLRCEPWTGTEREREKVARLRKGRREITARMVDCTLYILQGSHFIIFGLFYLNI